MNYITTTQLRTDSKKLVAAIQSGTKVSLIHRSQIIGIICPSNKKETKIQSTKELKKYLHRISPQIKLSPAKRNIEYNRYLKNRYGKSVS